jgi:alcohol oxidase
VARARLTPDPYPPSPARSWAKYISKTTGRRSDAASAYIHPVRKMQSNLHLLTNAKAARVIFEGDKAVGVSYCSPRHYGHEQVKEHVVRA